MPLSSSSLHSTLTLSTSSSSKSILTPPNSYYFMAQNPDLKD